MRKLLLTTISVLALGLALPAAAEQASPKPGVQEDDSGFFSYREVEGTMDVKGDDLGTITRYLDSNVLNRNRVTIGWVEDLLINPENNRVTHVVVDLRMEGKYIALPVKSLHPAPKERDALLTSLSDPELARLPSYEPMGEFWAVADSVDDGLMTASGPSEGNTQTLMEKAGPRGADMAADDILGRKVLTSDGYRAGEVSDLILDKDKAIVSVLMDVGGFMGFGEKTVSVPMKDISLAEGKSLYVSMTQEELEGLPEYTGKTD